MKIAQWITRHMFFTSYPFKIYKKAIICFFSFNLILNISKASNFSDIPPEIITKILFCCETSSCLETNPLKDVFNLGSTAKKYLAIADKYISEQPITLFTKKLNNDFLLEIINNRIPFQNIKIKHVNIVFIPGVITEPPKLKDNSELLDIQNTTLKSLSLIDVKPIYFNILMNQLSSLVSLTDLYIFKNGLSNIDIELSNPSVDLSKLSKLTSLKTLRLCNCSITGNASFLSSLTNLEQLSLNLCNLDELNLLSQHTNLKSLDLKNNPLVKNKGEFYFTEKHLELNCIKPLLNLTNLTELDISDQYLTKEAFNAFSSTVEIKHNGLK